MAVDSQPQFFDVSLLLRRSLLLRSIFGVLTCTRRGIRSVGILNYHVLVQYNLTVSFSLNNVLMQFNSTCSHAFLVVPKEEHREGTIETYLTLGLFAEPCPQ